MKEALKQIADLLHPVAALVDRTPFEHSEVIQRCVDASEIALEALAQPAQEPLCPCCKAEVLYECVACSKNNYPDQGHFDNQPFYTTPPQRTCEGCGKVAKP
jgi:hypothetical protein